MHCIWIEAFEWCGHFWKTVKRIERNERGCWNICMNFACHTKNHAYPNLKIELKTQHYFTMVRVRECECVYVILLSPFLRCTMYTCVQCVCIIAKWRDFGASRDRKVNIVYKIIDTWSFRQRQSEQFCQRTLTYIHIVSTHTYNQTQTHTHTRTRLSIWTQHPNEKKKKNVNRKQKKKWSEEYSNRMCLLDFPCCCCCCCCSVWTNGGSNNIFIQIKKCKYFCQKSNCSSIACKHKCRRRRRRRQRQQWWRRWW